ncbi:MAG: hypothetical protein V1822_00460 [Candidatus Micrarchaeota archaeon]
MEIFSAKNLAILCALLLVYSIYSQLSYSWLQSSSSQKISSLSSSLDAALKNSSSLYSSLQFSQKQLEGTNSTLEKTSQELEQEKKLKEQALESLQQAEQNLSDANSQLVQAQQKAAEIKSDVFVLQKNLNESMAWFRQNSALIKNSSWDVGIFLKRIRSDCIRDSTLNLACINYLNERTVLHLEYLNDSAAGEADHLQSLEQTISRRGGDCEDYALFFKAILQTLKSEGNGENLYLKGWVDPGPGEFQVWPQIRNPEMYVYISNATEKIFANLKDSTPYVICYTTDEYSGHCRIAFVNSSITLSTIQNLYGAQVYEPQNGRYAGTVGTDYIVCNSSQQQCYQTPGAITFVISDSDIIQITGTNWESYNDYLSQTSQIMSSLG